MTRASVGASLVASIHPVLATCVTGNGRTICTSSGGVLGVLLVVYAAILVVGIIAAVKVLTKAGYSGWWVLILFVPLLNFVMTLVFAFSEWPVLRELRSLRAQIRGPGVYGSPYGYGVGQDPWMTRYGGIPQAPGPGAGAASGGPGWSASAAPEPPLPPFGQASTGHADEEGGGDAGAGAAGTPGTPSADTTPSSTGAAATPATAGGAPQSGYPPAGWYPTPDGRHRYWDGAAWTDHFA